VVLLAEKQVENIEKGLGLVNEGTCGFMCLGRVRFGDFFRVLEVVF